ncbi:MAG: twin-arginine translocase TatA/TatE family subunit [bacterium]
MWPQGSEWILVVLAALIIFGPKNLPKIGRALGSGIKEFKDSIKGMSSSEEDEEKDKNQKSTDQKKDDTKSLSG